MADQVKTPHREASELDTLLEQIADLTHKINNPLSSVMGRVQLLQLCKPADPKLAKNLEVIAESADQVARYVRELALCARQHQAARRADPDAEPQDRG